LTRTKFVQNNNLLCLLTMWLFPIEWMKIANIKVSVYFNFFQTCQRKNHEKIWLKIQNWSDIYCLWNVFFCFLLNSSNYTFIIFWAAKYHIYMIKQMAVSSFQFLTCNKEILNYFIITMQFSRQNPCQSQPTVGLHLTIVKTSCGNIFLWMIAAILTF